VTCLQLTSTWFDLACLRYDAAMTMRSRRCLQAWIHIEDFLGICMGRFLKGKTWENLPFASICTSCWQFEHSLRESHEIGRNARNPIDPDHPWPSRTPSLIIPISRMQLWSRVCVSCPACPVQVWSFRFVQPVSLGCMTTVWWYSRWSLNFGKLWSWFATLFLHLGRVQWFLWDTWCQIEFPTLLYHDWSQFDRQSNQTIVEPQEASGNESCEKCLFSVFTAIIDCHLSLAKARGSSFFSTRLWKSPKQTQTQQDSRFQERISLTTFPHSWGFSVFCATGEPKDLSTLVESQVPKQEIDSLRLHCASPISERCHEA